MLYIGSKTLLSCSADNKGPLLIEKNVDYQSEINNLS